jgi:hypothetical protein
MRVRDRWWRLLQEELPSQARRPVSHSTTARRCGGGQGDHILSSKVGPHRGEEGPFLTSEATGRHAGIGEEMVDAVKRKTAALVGEAVE